VSEETHGSNGKSSSVVPVSAIELETLVARYRTALVALLDLAKREGWHRHIHDEMLLAEIETLLAAAAARGK
jgi:hypothetical protein